MTVEEALGRLSDLVSFLRWRVGAPEPGEVVAHDLVNDPERVAAEVGATAKGRGSTDPVVLGSLWWQSYTYRVAGTTMACWALSGAAPDPRSDAGTAVAVSRSRPSSIVYGPQAEVVTEVEDLVQRLFDGHLDPVSHALRVRHRVGQPLVWGNAVAGVASALSAVATAPGAPDVDARAQAVLGALPHDMGRLGQWGSGPQRWTFRRRTCCLWWKTTIAAGALCEDCSLR